MQAQLQNAQQQLTPAQDPHQSHYLLVKEGLLALAYHHKLVLSLQLDVLFLPHTLKLSLSTCATTVSCPLSGSFLVARASSLKHLKVRPPTYGKDYQQLQTQARKLSAVQAGPWSKGKHMSYLRRHVEVS